MIDTTLRVQFESYIRQLAVALRHEFAKHDQKHLHFHVDVSGRPDGDLKIEYSLSSQYYGEAAVKAGDLSDLVEEFLRRKGWQRRNAPLMLGNAGGESRSDEDE